jgi:hypothetical protein
VETRKPFEFVTNYKLGFSQASPDFECLPRIFLIAGISNAASFFIVGEKKVHESLLVLKSMASKTGPVSVYAKNPHYLCYKGKPIVLLTSDQHYGAVINADFNYAVFLEKLGSRGLNFTRIYPGAYIERENEFVAGNNLGPRDGRQILPWVRTGSSGAHPVLGGYRYDLDQWDRSYFARLRDYCIKAAEQGVIVEICFFNGMYENRWAFQATYHANNIQGVGTCDWDMVQSLTGDAKLVSYQERYLAEITRRLNDLDNVIFHVCDEPWMCRKPAAVFGPWVSRMIDVFRETENTLPKKHLLGQTVDLEMSRNEADFSADPRIQYIDVEYSAGIADLEKEYEHDKPIVYIESVIYPDMYMGDIIASSRVETWEFMVGGAAGFMQLNALYSTFNAAAGGTDIDAVSDIFVRLKAFLKNFHLYSMRRDMSFIVGGVPTGAFASAISDPGHEYGFYIHHSACRDPFIHPPDHPGASHSPRLHNYEATSGSYHETFTFHFPKGHYEAEWIDPANGSVIKRDRFQHKGGDRSLRAPSYSIDIALRMFNRKQF